MARLVGIDLPKNKRIIIGIQYIFGIGPKIAKDILLQAKISENLLIKDLSEDDIVKLRSELANIEVEGDLRRRVHQNIQRLKNINCYKGYRHKLNLPVRGQKTKTNARTKRGKRIAIAGKKKVTK